MAKANKETVFMMSEEGSGFFYSFRRNKKKGRKEGKISLKKYDPIARRHVTFGEKKLSKLKKKYVRRDDVATAASSTDSANS
jgi:large subunit ribosomal protein L33